jgi:hypothetical protein
MASREDFEMQEPYEQLACRTLEEVIAEGESDTEKKTPPEHITVNNMPQWIAAVMTNLKKKKRNLSVAAAERTTAKLGIAVVRERFSEPIGNVSHLRGRVYELTDQLLLKKSYRGGAYELQETVGTVYRKVSLREWTAGAISDQLIDPIGLSSSTALLLVMVAGISKSETWVPRGWVKLADKELEHFQRFLEEEAKRLQKEVLGSE